MMDTPSTPNDWPNGAMPQRIIQYLFDKMLTKWGKQFIDKWSMVDPDKLQLEWARALGKLSEMEFRRGVAKLDSFDRPPSQPEFLKACRPEVNPLNAYYEALEGCRSREQGECGTWSHPAIFWASVRVSAHDLKSQTYSQMKLRWESALAAELAKDEWEPIPAPMIALQGPGKGKLSRESATKMMQKLRETSGVKPGAVDPKQWARKIMDRHKNGDKTLLPIQIQFAREALSRTGEYEDG